MKIEQLPIGKVRLNEGQIEGLPKNPRQWTQSDIDRIAKSLKETPELFEMRPCIVAEHEGEYILLAGNLRYCGAVQNGDKKVPCIVVPADMSVEKMKEIVLKDNGSFGSWDFDELANNWDDMPLAEWGILGWSFDEDGNTTETGGGVDCEDAEQKSYDSRLVIATCSLNGESEDLVLCEKLSQEQADKLLAEIDSKGAKAVISNLLEFLQGGVNDGEGYNGEGSMVALILCRHHGEKTGCSCREG